MFSNSSKPNLQVQNPSASASAAAMGFDELYLKKLHPIITNLEYQRKSIVCSIFLSIIAAFAFIYLAFEFFPSFMESLSLEIIIIAMCAVTSIGLLLIAKKHKRYKEHFKNNIIKVLIERLFPGFSFEAKKGISQTTYSSSQLFQKTPDRYKSEDWISGTVERTPVHFSEVHSQFKTTYRTKNGTRTQWHTIFQGVFFVADFNKHIHGRTFVFPDVAEKTMGSFLGGLLQKAATSIDNRGELVKLENVAFEKAFKVLSDNQIEARYILTPKLMEDILKIKTRFKQVPFISFIGNHVYVAIPFKTNFFEASLFSPCTSKNELKGYADLVKSVFTIVEDLDLNTRIWTKD